jgi:hypothetical protein
MPGLLPRSEVYQICPFQSISTSGIYIPEVKHMYGENLNHVANRHKKSGKKKSKKGGGKK